MVDIKEEKVALLVHRLDKDIKIVNAMDKVVRVDLIVMVVKDFRVDKIVVKVDLIVMVAKDFRVDKTVDKVDLIAVAKVETLVVDREEVLYHLQIILQQIKLLQRNLSKERNLYIIEKIKMNLMKTNSLKQKRKLKLQQA